MRYLFGFLCVCALGMAPLAGCGPDNGGGGNGGSAGSGGMAGAGGVAGSGGTGGIAGLGGSAGTGGSGGMAGSDGIAGSGGTAGTGGTGGTAGTGGSPELLGFVVAWYEDDEFDEAEPRVRGFAANGTARFSDTSANSDRAALQGSPQVSAARDGDFVVVWDGDHDGDDQYDVYARGFHADGTERFAEMKASTVTEEHMGYAVAVAQTGDFVVAWSPAQIGAGNNIYARGFHANGTERFAYIKVNGDDAAWWKSAAAVGVTGNGDFVVLWLGDPDGDFDFDIYARGFHANGTERFAERILKPEVATGCSSSMAMDQDGKFVVVWDGDHDGDDQYDVYARGFHADGTERFAEMKVTSEAVKWRGCPSVGMAENSDFAVVWMNDPDRDNNSHIYARGFHANGTERFAPITVSREMSWSLYPKTAMAPSGEFVVAWRGGSVPYDLTAGKDAYARGFHADGTELFSEIRVNSDPVEDQSASSVATWP